MEEKKQKKVLVDEDFLKEILKVQKEFKERLGKFESSTSSIQKERISEGVFVCTAIDTDNNHNREEFNKQFKIFERDLELLMRRYKIVALNANIFQSI